MDKHDDCLDELQQLDTKQGIAKLRTLLVEFDETLERLPKLKKQAEAMLEPQEGVNYDELTGRLEQQLESAADLLMQYELLPDDIVNEPGFAEFWKKANATMTMRTVGKLSAELSKQEAEAKSRIKPTKLEAQRKAAVEAKAIRRKEKEARRKVEAEAEARRRAEAAAEKERRRNLGFIINGDGTVTDPVNGLMWADHDNERNIFWQDAKRYCEECRTGEYTDWRMPTLTELQSLFIAGLRYHFPKVPDTQLRLHSRLRDLDEDDNMRGPIRISDYWVWSSETQGSDVSYYITNFGDGIRFLFPESHAIQALALPVRSVTNRPVQSC